MVSEMNVLIFLIISLLVHSIPFPWSRSLLEFRTLIKWLPQRLIWGTVAWALITLALQLVLPWAVFALGMSFFIQLLVYNITGLRFRRIQFDERYTNLSLAVLCVGIIGVIVIPISAGVVSWTSGVANAWSFDDFIVKANGTVFENPIPDDQVRLVTDTLANFQARKYMSAIGSNVEIAATHITTRNGRLVWVCVVVSSNVLAENYVQGFIVVDANEPDNVEVIKTQFPVAEGLFWDKNIQFGNYIQDMTNIYEYAYPTWDPVGELVYVQTRTNMGADFVERPLGPIVYCANGTVIKYDTLQDTPVWITQAYSEEWLERQISRWGGYRRGDSFDLFAGGLLWFIQPSRDRIAMTEDTRYILNPDTGRVEALVTLHPYASTTLTLSGLIRATRDRIYFYDMSNQSMISGEAAVNTIIKDLPKPTSGNYYGAMPLLYPVRFNSTYTRQVWYCPIYWYLSEYDEELEDYVLTDFKLYGLGMVDANSIDITATKIRGSLPSQELVRQTREEYVNEARIALGMEPEPTDTIVLNATVLNVTSYVEDGDTHIVLRTDNSTYEWIEGTKSWMRITDWYQLLTVRPGDTFTATIEVVEGEFRIVAFTKH